MKKFIIIAISAVVLYVIWSYAYYQLGIYIDLDGTQETAYFMTVEGDAIYKTDPATGEKELFEIRGVNMGSGEPGEWSTDFDIDRETYLRWFGLIQEMGANTVRIYTIQSDDFYEAYYDYNTAREAAGEEPLWLLQGVWVNDYVQNSHRDAFDDDFLGTFLEDCRTMVNVIHGKQRISLGRVASAGSGTYRRDVSPWVIGYILGVEWEDVTVTYTNHKYEGMEPYQGTYFCAREDASPFESMLAQVLDKTVEYETGRFGAQRLMAFSNWPTTDPFTYSTDITLFFMKSAQVDAERVQPTENFLSGYFASYHVYPYFPDYLNYVYQGIEAVFDSSLTIQHRKEAAQRAHQYGTPYDTVLDPKNFFDPSGQLNTYYAYLTMLTEHHNMPVIISEFGVSTGRGMAQRDYNTNRNQGHMSEQEQGQALQSCYEDIMAAGCAGSCIFSWQDEWFKRTWNTMYAVDLKRTPYWSDYQTNEQYFGLLSFDPGEEESICYVNGDVSEWTEEDVVSRNGDMTLSMKYDEKFIYFLVEKEGLSFGEESIYIPIDTTPKSGTTYSTEHKIAFDRPVDFLIAISGKTDSRVLVQERYEALRSTFSQDVWDVDAYIDPPDVDSPVFKPIELILQTATPLLTGNWEASAEVYETGLLRYGNADPASPDFDSLADFIHAGDYIEIKLPWQLLNFSDPSKMEIHDDYYDDNYGVAYLNIDEMYVGITGEWAERDHAPAVDRVELDAVPLEGWGNRVTYHERLKPSYYAVQEMWKEAP